MNARNRQSFWMSLGAVGLSAVILVLVIFKPWEIRKKDNSFFGEKIDNFCINDICLRKDSDNWMTLVGKSLVPANTETVNDYVGKFEKIEFGDVISSNDHDFANLGIGVSQVIIAANGKSLEVGNVNSNYDGTYVREENGKNIYNVGILLEKNNLVNLDQWINRTITNLPVLQTSKITISQNGKNKEFTPKNGTWDDPNWMQKVDSLNAQKYLDSFAPGPETKTTISIETENRNLTLTLGEKKQDKTTSIFWVTSDSKYYYSLSAEDYRLLTDKIK